MDVLSRNDGATNDFADQPYLRLTEQGHGLPGRDYLLAIKHWHEFTAGSYFAIELAVDITFQGSWLYSWYERVSVAGPEDNYRLQLGQKDPASTAGEQLDGANNQ